jgi:hypothetical protein
MSEVKLPDPKYIYHDNGVPGEDDLFEFAESGAVDVRDDGTPCPNCERLYTADQIRAAVLAERERCANLAEDMDFGMGAIAAAIRGNGP